jgi:hypothetical protein
LSDGVNLAQPSCGGALSCARKPGENAYAVACTPVFTRWEEMLATMGTEAWRTTDKTCNDAMRVSQAISRLVGRTRIPRTPDAGLLAHMLLGGDETFDITGPVALDQATARKVCSPCPLRDKTEAASLHFVG